MNSVKGNRKGEKKETRIKSRFYLFFFFFFFALTLKAEDSSLTCLYMRKNVKKERCI